jgi:hypothetical protein
MTKNAWIVVTLSRFVLVVYLHVDTHSYRRFKLTEIVCLYFICHFNANVIVDKQNVYSMKTVSVFSVSVFICVVCHYLNVKKIS